MQVANASEVPFRRVFKIRKISARFFCQTKSGKAYAHDKRTKRERSALKGQPVLSPGQRPGCQRINAHAL